MTEATTTPEVKETYKFEHNKTYADGEQHTNVKIFTVNRESAQWGDVAQDFLTWLSSVYGYDITKYFPELEYHQTRYSLNVAEAAQDCPGCAY